MISRSIVFDTNVLVSAALKEFSNPAAILKLVIEREVTPLVCPDILEEYKEVFARPKFKKWKFPPSWFDRFVSLSIWVQKNPPLWPIPGPDSDDLVFLSLANHQGATLITGNLKDYPEKIRRGTQVVDPAEYLNWIRT